MAKLSYKVSYYIMYICFALILVVLGMSEFCKVLSAFSSIVFFLFKTTLFAKYFKMVQFNATCSSQIVVS